MSIQFYRYSTHGSHMLSAIVEKVSGQRFYQLNVSLNLKDFSCEGLKC